MLRVIRSVDSGILVRTPGGLPGGGGVGGMASSSSSASSSSRGAIIAGLSLAFAMISESRPGKSTLMPSSVRSKTLNGPSYGEVSVGWTPPLRTNTWVHVSNSSGTCTLGVRCADVGIGWRRSTSTLRCCRERRWRLRSSSSDNGTDGRISPGTEIFSP